jgi:ubiquinone/menaquinone biosynthesis C-methylase UbiE
MGFWDERVVPWCIELCCGSKAIAKEREKALAGLSGTVLEIGFGSGLNVPLYPAGIARVLAVDPSERARRIGRKRIAAARCPIETVGLDAESIRLDARSADNALSTFTLCTIPDAGRALVEVKRILRPGGRLYFLEHGRAPDPGVARWQDRLNGMQRAIAGGCNINREIPALLEGAGFRVESLESYYAPGPPTHTYLYRGVAVAPG